MVRHPTFHGTGRTLHPPTGPQAHVGTKPSGRGLFDFVIRARTMSGVSATMVGGDARRSVTEIVIATKPFSRARDHAQASGVGDLFESWMSTGPLGFSAAEFCPDLTHAARTRHAAIRTSTARSYMPSCTGKKTLRRGFRQKEVETVARFRTIRDGGPGSLPHGGAKSRRFSRPAGRKCFGARDEGAVSVGAVEIHSGRPGLECQLTMLSELSAIRQSRFGESQSSPKACRSRPGRFSRGSATERSHPCTDAPEFREEFDLEHALEVADARRAACASLQADDALDRRDVVETPAPEIVLEVDQLFRQLVEVPVMGGIAVDLGPGAGQRFAFDVRLGRLGPRRGLANIEAPPAQQENRLLIEARLGEDCAELSNDLRA
jgi:hypothetical protein